MKIFLHKNDLPADHGMKGDIAFDTETMGLNIYQRDRLCLAQLSDGSGVVHLVQFIDQNYKAAKNLIALLGDDSRQKIIHFARFDVAAAYIYLGVDMRNVYCTKIASRLCRTYTDRHGLKELCREMLDVDLSKQQQSSNWSAGELTQAQQEYAASDVLYLHKLRDKTQAMLKEAGRLELAQHCFAFLPTRVQLDIKGWINDDIFQH